jgi:predicted amidohydrolase YtcJ
VDCAAPHVRCIDDVQSILRNKAAESDGDRWVRGSNLSVDVLAEKRLPTRWELDAAVPHLPVVLIDRAGQFCILNTQALKRCGMGEDTPAKSAAGVIFGSNDRVARAIPPLSHAEIEIGLRAADREFLSHGITSIQDTSWSNGYRHWQAMQQFKERRLLTSRITMHAGIDALDELAQHGLKTGTGNDTLRLGAIKLALDESTGNDNPPQADLDQLAMNAHRAGFQLAFHVPNTNFLRMSLQTLRVIENSTGQRCYRPRFEHCPVCPPFLLPELASSGAIVVSQPNLLYQTGPAYLSEVDDEQLQWIFPYRSFVNCGIQLALSSDAPLTPCNPLQALRTTVTRAVEGGKKLAQHEAIGLVQALDMYSRAGAYCSNEEALKGSLAPGQLADLVVLDCGGEEHLSDAFFNASVSMTLVDGKVVWTR